MIRRYIEFVLGHRVLILIACALITALAGWSLTRGVFASSIIKLFFGDSDDYRQYREFSNRFTDPDVMVVAFDAPDLFQPQGWERLHQVTEELTELDFLRRADSVTSAVDIRGENESLDIQTYQERYEQGVPLAELKKSMLEDELLSGLFLGKDGATTAILLEFIPNDDRPVESMPLLLDDIYAAFEKHGMDRKTLHAAGLVPESVEATNQAIYNVQVIFPFTALLLIGTVYFLFRQLWPVFITSGIALVSILWTFGFAVALEPQINIMMAMVPAVSLVVAFSDIIHLCSSYMFELRRGATKEEAILKSATEVGEACFFTSVTTLVGFISMAFVPIPVFRHVGTVLGFGVFIALLLAMTLVPIAFTLLPTPKVDRYQRRRSTKLITVITDLCMNVSMNWPKSTVAGFVVVIALCIVGIGRIEIEASMLDRLDPQNPVRQSRLFIEKNFDGTNYVDIYLATKNKEFTEPERYAQLQNLDQSLESFQSVDRANSFVDVVDRMHQKMNSVDTKRELSRALIAQYMLLFEMSGGEDIDKVIDEPKTTTRLILHTSETGFVSTAHVAAQAQQKIKDIFGETVESFVGGLNVLFGRWVEFVIEGQKRGLTFAIFSTTIMMLICLKLLWPGIISMIPNLFPLLILGGYCGWAWDTFDTDTMLVFMISIGIAVDDTVHFMTRLRLESKQSLDVKEAVRRTFDFSGSAIVKTTLILVLGFLPFATSDYFSTRILGTLLPMTLVAALVADLVLLPALLQLGILKMPLATDEPA